MTDLNERFAAMLEGEPTAPYDLERVVAGGRRALRRRTTLTTVAGTAGTAAVTAAIVVPITMNGTGGSAGSTGKITVATRPTAAAKRHCELYDVAGGSNKHTKQDLHKIVDRPRFATGFAVHTYAQKDGKTIILVCPTGATMKKAAPNPTSTLPPYSYSADPATIATQLGDELSKQVKALGFSIVYSSPFAQESSTLEKGHPTYFDGSDDVQLPDGPANIGVQVTHEVTQLVPFDGPCNAPDCTQTKLPDGSIEQISHIHSGTGGAMVIAVEIHEADGLIVEAQEANYAFGPEATRARSSEPLTIDQLTQLAEDPAFAF